MLWIYYILRFEWCLFLSGESLCLQCRPATQTSSFEHLQLVTYCRFEVFGPWFFNCVGLRCSWAHSCWLSAQCTGWLLGNLLKAFFCWGQWFQLSMLIYAGLGTAFSRYFKKPFRANATSPAEWSFTKDPVRTRSAEFPLPLQGKVYEDWLRSLARSVSPMKCVTWHWDILRYCHCLGCDLLVLNAWNVSSWKDSHGWK